MCNGCSATRTHGSRPLSTARGYRQRTRAPSNRLDLPPIGQSGSKVVANRKASDWRSPDVLDLAGGSIPFAPIPGSRSSSGGCNAMKNGTAEGHPSRRRRRIRTRDRSRSARGSCKPRDSGRSTGEPPLYHLCAEPPSRSPHTKPRSSAKTTGASFPRLPWCPRISADAPTARMMTTQSPSGVRKLHFLTAVHTPGLLTYGLVDHDVCTEALDGIAGRRAIRIPPVDASARRFRWDYSWALDVGGRSRRGGRLVDGRSERSAVSYCSWRDGPRGQP
jgi:hypothetical protein